MPFMPPPRKRKRKRIAEDEPPTKWTAPILGYPVTEADGNIVEVEGVRKFTDEQKRTFARSWKIPNTSETSAPSLDMGIIY